MKLTLETECSTKTHPLGHPLAELLRPFRVWANKPWKLTIEHEGRSLTVTDKPDVEALKWLNVHLGMGRLTLALVVASFWGDEQVEPMIDQWDRS